MGVSLGGFKMSAHRLPGLIWIVFSNRSIDGPMLPQTCLGHAWHLIGPPAHFDQRLRDGFQNHDGERISGRSRDRFVEANIGGSNCLMKLQVSLGSTSVQTQRGFLFRQHAPHRQPVGFGGFLGGERHQTKFKNFTKLNQRICLLHERGGRQILRIDERDRRRLKHHRADLWPDTNELKRLQRLNGFANACPADRELFRQLLFSGKPLARFDLAPLNEAEYVSDNLGGDGLSAYQARILRGQVPGRKQAACLRESYHNCFVHYSQLLSPAARGLRAKMASSGRCVTLP